MAHAEKTLANEAAAPFTFQIDHNAERIELTQQLASDPGNVQLRMRLAQTQLLIGDGVGAEATLKELPAPQRESGQGAALMGHALLLQRRVEEALAWSAKAGPDEPLGAWVEVGALLAEGREDEAMARITAALAAHPTDAPLLALRGEIALAQRAIGAAQSFADRALKADPDALAALVLAGRLAVLRDDLEAAERHYTRAARRNGGAIAPLLGLAAVQADRGKVEEARVTLKQLRQIAPTHPIGVFLDAKLAFVTGDLDEANRLMQQGEGDLRGVPAAQLLSGEIAHLRGNNEAAIATLRPFMRDNPLHMQGAMVLAQAYLATGDKARALSVLEAPAQRAAASVELLTLASRLAGKPAAIILTPRVSLQRLRPKMPMPGSRRLTRPFRAESLPRLTILTPG